LSRIVVNATPRKGSEASPKEAPAFEWLGIDQLRDESPTGETERGADATEGRCTLRVQKARDADVQI
jgi:hypothetical protein